jgi:hypothetical protein
MHGCEEVEADRGRVRCVAAARMRGRVVSWWGLVRERQPGRKENDTNQMDGRVAALYLP